MKINQGIILIITILSLIPITGCLDLEYDEKDDPDDVVTEFYERLIDGNYSRAISMMIDYKGERLSDQDQIDEMISTIDRDYDMIYSGYIDEFYIDMENKVVTEDDEDYRSNIYNVSYILNWDGVNRSITISVIEFYDSNDVGVYFIDEDDLIKKIMFLPLPAREGDISLNISMDEDTYRVDPISLDVTIEFSNNKYHPLLVPGESKAYGYHLCNLNGTYFSIPRYEVCDRDIPPRRLIEGREIIRFDKGIKYMDWHYFESYSINDEVNGIRYLDKFDLDVPGDYGFQVSYTCYNNPSNYFSSDYSMTSSNSNILYFTLVEDL